MAAISASLPGCHAVGQSPMHAVIHAYAMIILCVFASCESTAAEMLLLPHHAGFTTEHAKRRRHWVRLNHGCPRVVHRQRASLQSRADMVHHLEPQLGF